MTVHIAANDITDRGVPLDLESIDLDPVTPGRQPSITTVYGTYSLLSGGIVCFQPASPWVSGSIGTQYTIRDVKERLSNPAEIVVNVGAAAGEPFNLEFDSGAPQGLCVDFSADGTAIVRIAGGCAFTP